MVIGMPRQLYDGMIDYDDGVPTSTPQMAFDVANFITYMQRRSGGKKSKEYGSEQDFTPGSPFQAQSKTCLKVIPEIEEE